MDELLPPNPQTYVRLTVRRLWEGLPLVGMAGFIFSLCCMPAFILFILGWPILAILVGALTIAPAWAALLAQEVDILQDEATNLMPMVWALPRCWLRSAKLGLLAAFPLVVGWLTLPNLAAAEVPPVIWIGLAADALGLLLLITLSLYAFPLLILYDIELGPALHNALILSSRYLMHTLGLLSLAGLFLWSILYLNSGLLFILPAVWGLFVVNNCRLVIHLEEGSPYD
jgi:uncharacterized membrane protein YesL